MHTLGLNATLWEMQLLKEPVKFRSQRSIDFKINKTIEVVSNVTTRWFM